MKLDLPLAAGVAVLFLAAFAGAGASGQPAPAAPKKPAQACFYARNVSSWSAVDRHTINLRVNVRDYYQLKLLGDCGDIDFSQRIGLQSRGSDWICSGLDVTVIAPSPIGPQRCAATGLRKLTPEEVAALPPKQKP